MCTFGRALVTMHASPKPVTVFAFDVGHLAAHGAFHGHAEDELAPSQLADETPVRHRLPLQVQVRDEAGRYDQINRAPLPTT